MLQEGSYSWSLIKTLHGKIYIILQRNCSQQGGSSKDLTPCNILHCGATDESYRNRGEPEIFTSLAFGLYFFQREKMTTKRDVQLLCHVKSSAGKAEATDRMVRNITVTFRNPKAYVHHQWNLGRQISSINAISILGLICQPKPSSKPWKPGVIFGWKECFL